MERSALKPQKGRVMLHFKLAGGKAGVPCGMLLPQCLFAVGCCEELGYNAQLCFPHAASAVLMELV